MYKSKCWVALFPVSVLMFAACERTKEREHSGESSGSSSPSDTREALPANEAAAYFPMAEGTTWVYAIEVGDLEPLDYQESSWPLAEGKETTFAYITRFTRLAKPNAPRTFQLVLEAKGSVANQGPKRYPLGTELLIKKDDLGVFENSNRLFLAAHAHQDDRFMAYRIVTYPAGVPNDRRDIMLSRGDGYAETLLFFSDKAGIEIRIGRESKQALEFVGYEKQVPGYTGMTLLHFRRTVERLDLPKEVPNAGTSLNSGFSEGGVARNAVNQLGA